LFDLAWTGRDQAEKNKKKNNDYEVGLAVSKKARKSGRLIGSIRSCGYDVFNQEEKSGKAEIRWTILLKI